MVGKRHFHRIIDALEAGIKSNPLKLFAGIKLKFQEKWQPAVAWLAKIFCLGVSRRICDRVILSVKDVYKRQV